MWVEINGRVNYPIKSALIGMQQHGEITWTHQLINFATHGSHCEWYLLVVLSLSKPGIIILFQVHYKHYNFVVTVFILTQS